MFLTSGELSAKPGSMSHTTTLFCLLLLSALSNGLPLKLPKATNYDESLARRMMYLAAGAYSDKPEQCLQRRFQKAEVSASGCMLVNMLGMLIIYRELWSKSQNCASEDCTPFEAGIGAAGVTKCQSIDF